MIRRCLAAAAAVVSVATALLLAQAPPASASGGLLPSPVASLVPIPLPSLLPTPPPAVPVPVPVPAPVTSAVTTVVGAVPNLPFNPSQSGQPAPAPVGGAGSGDGSATPGSDQAPPPYQPPPEERAALPPEPQRTALEGQQAFLRDGAGTLDQEDAASALALGGGDGRFTWPIAFRGHPPITQRFGCTDVPGEPYSADCVTHRFHTGLDLGVHQGTPVYAAAPGVAHVYRSDSGYGIHVLVAHGGGWFTLYAHLSEVVVRDGEPVRRGDPVGLSGSTGFSTGPHLHFEVRYGGQYQDPCVYLGC